LAQHTSDWYMGLPIQKFPEDLRVYEHLLWEARPEVVVELGGHPGGSVLWFRDRILDLARYGGPTRPRVVSVSLDTSATRAGVARRDPGWADTISFVDGDVRDPDLPGRLEALVGDAPCLVVEDTLHTYDTTWAALTGFSRFVAPGGYFVVEDGVVDVPALRSAATGGGVLTAVEHWLDTARGSDFVRRRDLERYGLTRSPGGWLQRR
nr:CmcI family methyltransferase [Micromonospora sp. DSM 115978]